MSSKRYGSPAQWMALAAAYSKMSMAAAEVITRRSLMMAKGAMTGPEATRMVLEKMTAFTTAAEKSAVAAAKGANPAGIAAAALRPYSSKARANARRLGR